MATASALDGKSLVLPDPLPLDSGQRLDNVRLAVETYGELAADKGNAIAGWVLGAAVCFTVLIVYGFVCRSLGLPPTAAMLSLATFFFLTELIEPPFLTI